MVRKYFFSFLCFIIINNFAHAQYCSWQKNYSNASIEWLYAVDMDVQKDAVFLAANALLKSDNQPTALFSNMDKEGKIKFAKTIENKTNRLLITAMTKQNDDFVFVGGDTLDAAIFKVNKNGQMVWSKKGKFNQNLGTQTTTWFNIFKGVKCLKDNSILAFGSYADKSSGAIQNQWSYVSMFDANGKLDWEKGFLKENNRFQYCTAEYLGDDKVMLIGWYSEDYSLLNANMVGVLLERKSGKYIKHRVWTFGPYSPRLNSMRIFLTDKNDLNIITETIDSPDKKNGYIFMNIDTNFNVKRSRFLTARSDFFSISSIQQEANGNFVISNQEAESGKKYMYIIDNQFDKLIDAKRYYSEKGFTIKFIFRTDDTNLGFGVSDTKGRLELRKFDIDATGHCSEKMNPTWENLAIGTKAVDLKEFWALNSYENSPLIIKKITLTEKEEKPCEDKIDTTICQGNKLIYNSLSFDKPGTYKVPKVKNNCIDSAIINLKVIPKVINIDTTICEGKSISIGKNKYQTSGTFQDVFKNRLGCDSIVNVTLAMSNLKITAPDDLTLSAGDNHVFSPTVQGIANEWSWSPTLGLSCVDCQNTTLNPLKSSTYMITAKNKFGCESSDSVKVALRSCDRFFVPNSFSPDDDGYNDIAELFVESCVQKIVSYQIFDRWGNLIFQANDIAATDNDKMWNGTYQGQKANKGVYVLKAILQTYNGVQKTVFQDIMLH